MGSSESGPQKHQAGPAFEKVVWSTLFPQTSIESILQAHIFQSSFRGLSHHWCRCHLKTFNIPKKSSALSRTGHDAPRIHKSLKKMSPSFREEIKLKSPEVLGIFFTSNNAVTYCRLFMERWHSSLKASLFYCFLEVLHLHVMTILPDVVTVRNIHYILVSFRHDSQKAI